jgi:hypothetical protein
VSKINSHCESQLRNMPQKIIFIIILKQMALYLIEKFLDGRTKQDIDKYKGPS